MVPPLLSIHKYGKGKGNCGENKFYGASAGLRRFKMVTVEQWFDANCFGGTN